MSRVLYSGSCMNPHFDGLPQQASQQILNKVRMDMEKVSSSGLGQKIPQITMRLMVRPGKCSTEKVMSIDYGCNNKMYNNVDALIADLQQNFELSHVIVTHQKTAHPRFIHHPCTCEDHEYKKQWPCWKKKKFRKKKSLCRRHSSDSYHSESDEELIDEINELKHRLHNCERNQRKIMYMRR